MKYNSKYDRYVTNGGLVYRYSKKQDKLILCKLTTDRDGYLKMTVSKPENKSLRVHRLVYETFNGEIPDGYDIDHINTIRNDNRLKNLRVATRSENMLNPITIKRSSEAKKGKICSDFGKKFFEHYGFSRCDNVRLYEKEYHWYRYHNFKCRWE